MSAVQFDEWHAAIVDAVCQADAARARAGERSWTRLAEPHEFCHPLGRCTTWPTLVRVRVLGDGLRIREPLCVPGAAA